MQGIPPNHEISSISILKNVQLTYGPAEMSAGLPKLMTTGPVGLLSKLLSVRPAKQWANLDV
jgi:hypothetical protein